MEPVIRRDTAKLDTPSPAEMSPAEASDAVVARLVEGGEDRSLGSQDLSPASGWGLALAGIALLIIVACLAVALMNYDTMGGIGLAFIIGFIAVIAIGVWGYASIGQNKRLNDRRQADRGSVYSQAFFEGPDPSLIMSEGKPLHANKAYLDLAKTLGVETVGDKPPAIDRLFRTTSDEIAAAIFRLYHIRSDLGEDSEVLDYLTPKDGMKRFKVSVRPLGGDASYKLWQVKTIVSLSGSGQGLLANAPIGLLSVDQTGRVVAINQSLLKWLGLEDKPNPDVLGDVIEGPRLVTESAAVDGRKVRADTRLLTRKGIATPVVVNGQWIIVDSGELVCNIALYGHSTIASGHASEAAATQSVGKAEGASLSGMASAPVGLLEIEVSDSTAPLKQARVINANPAFERMSTGSGAARERFADIFTDADGDHRFLDLSAEQCDPSKPFDAILAGDDMMPVSVYVLLEGEVGLTEEESAARRASIFLVDVSARKSLEDQLVQSQKMQAIGQLAAGVAHDFNNLLTAIRLNTDELLQRHPIGDPSYPELQNINSTGLRAASLVKKLLAFSRKQTRRTEVLSVTDTLSDMAMTLRQTLGEKAKVVMVHGRNLPPVMADKSQVDTVLMNLCVNARDAMADQGGGTITVKSAQLSRSDVTEPALSEALLNIPSDDFVTIEVSDTGTGMSEEIMSKIFEPFFTTKEQGKGTGLGLATVYGIVQQTGGHLDVKSKLGQGTTFRITLPVADPERVAADLEAQKAAPVVDVRKPANLSGQGTILFVEDEASVRVIAAKTMRKRGYTVVEAEDGEEALEILEDGEHTFDMMISDVVMPGMDGPTLLKEGRALLGDARIVFISGYAEEQFSDLLSEEPDVTFLPKPFTLAQLAEKVKAEIGDAS